ncbi:serine aminopeptidase domain-containing protein [Paraburkholderia phenoliruptrix]|uniref:serine aminopeptidase domain-containing protein n=1 Tax=Paraburkholderia phenoliruptrix TaxID=252970 RepID=UPI003D95F6C8
MATMTPVTFDGCFGWLHRPKDLRAAACVVLCNPFGYEALSAYRGARELADALAASGVAALRFDYPGTGDSSGNEDDPLRWRAWLDSIKAAVTLLREESGASRVTLCGLRLGATLAALAAHELGGVDDLVLLMPVISGKAYIRELELQQQTWLGAQRALGLELEEEPYGTVGAHGFRLYPDTLALLANVDLERSAESGDAAGGERLARRVLLHDINDSARLRRLAARYEALGAQVQVQFFRRVQQAFAESELQRAAAPRVRRRVALARRDGANGAHRAADRAARVGRAGGPGRPRGGCRPRGIR